MQNMTDLLHNHSEELEYASSTAFSIHSSLEKAAASAKSLNETSFISGSFGDFAIRLIVPLASVFLGNYGLAPSLSRNAVLILGG